MNKTMNKINSMANELGLVKFNPNKKPSKLYRCGDCCDDLAPNGQTIYTWKELIKHKHKLSYYWYLEDLD